MITNISLEDALFYLVWKVDDMKNYLKSRIRSAFLYLTITLVSPRKSKPQYVGPKVRAINRYSRPTMKPMYDQSGWQQMLVPCPNTSARLKRMETELDGATAAPDTGSKDYPYQPWPWLPLPAPGPKTSGFLMCLGNAGSSPYTIPDTACPDTAEIIPGLVIAL